MISYDESQKILKQVASEVSLPAWEEIDLIDSVQRILAEDIYARESNPPFDNSAMDGFVVKVSKLSANQKKGIEWIPVDGLIAAGDDAVIKTDAVMAVEIMTGAPLPSAEFDSVVRVEDVQVRNIDGKKEILVSTEPVLNDNIRRHGEDIKSGDLLLRCGQVIHENHLLVFASQGISRLKVKRLLKICILSTGQEIIDYRAQNLKPHQIRNSTGIYLEYVLKNPRTQVLNFGIIQDDPNIYKQNLLKAFDQGSDIVVSTGAVSMGVYDFVRSVIEKLGAKIHFHKCAIRPGKPILFASLDYKGSKRYLFGIPGNPVSTAVGYNFFVKPFLNSIFHLLSDHSQKMRLKETTKKPEGLRCFFKAKVDDNSVENEVISLKGQASFMVSPLVETNAWVILPEKGYSAEKGDQVEVLRI